jgi:hypothetical protein
MCGFISERLKGVTNVLLSVTAMKLRRTSEHRSGTKEKHDYAHGPVDQRIAPVPEDCPVWLDSRATGAVDVEQRRVGRVQLRDPCHKLRMKRQDIL